MGNLVTRQNFLEKQNISQELVSFIKQQIINGELNPGDRIIETKLAKELGISQTPVREAIRQLSGEGVVHIVPNKGPVVCMLGMKDVFEIYSLRAVIEALAIRLATQNATEEDIQQLKDFYEKMKRKLDDGSIPSLLQDSSHIHQSIVFLSNHSRLISTYEAISFQIAIVNRILGRDSTKQKEVDQHWELIDALIRRNPEHAENVMRKHIYRSYREFVQLKEEGKTNKEMATEYGEDMWFNKVLGE